MTEDDGSVVAELLAIRAIGALHLSRISEISILRVLDIVVWMEHVADHRTPHKSTLIFRGNRLNKVSKEPDIRSTGKLLLEMEKGSHL